MRTLAIATVLIGVFLIVVIVGSILRAAGSADERHASIDDDAQQDADDAALEREKDRLYGGGWG